MQITCENARGEKLALTQKYKILSADGLGADFDVYTTQSSGQDGVSYNGAAAKKRNIVLVFDVYKADPSGSIDALYLFFQPRSPGVLYYQDGKIQRKIGYYVEKLSPSGYQMLRTVTLSLICPDPKWYALDDRLTQLAVWRGRLTFPLRIHPPFAISKKQNTLIGNVYNGSNVAMGLTVRFSAAGEVVNPSLYDVNSHELMQINTTMHAGDKIFITTGDGDKRVKLLSGGMETNINNLMAYPPKWLKAYQGDNLFRYNADSGIDSLSVTILSTQAYWGA